MFMLDDIMLFTKLAGGGLLGAEVLSLYLKNRTHKTEELATSKIGSGKDLKGLTGNDGIKLSKNIQLNSKFTREHVAVIGATGAGKTTSIFYPNLLSPDIKGSIIVSDPKGEIYRDTANYQKSIGREPILFCPLSPIYSYRYNPLALAKDTTEVIELAQCLLINGAKSLEIQTGVKAGGIEWIQMSLSLFVASLLYCKNQGYPLNTINNAIKLIINYDIEELELLFKGAGEEVTEQYNIFKTSAESPKTASSIKVTLTSNLQIFLNRDIIETTKTSDFNARLLREKHICLYVCYPEQKANYLSPFTSVFYSQLISHLMQLEGLPIKFMFDEFANVGILNNFSNTVSTSRSRDISFLICLQSISQLEQLYGKDNTKSILNNLKTKCILPGISDTQTLNYISELSGDTQITLKSTSISNNKTSNSYSTSKKKLFNSDEIRRLDTEEILIVAHNRQPILDTQNIYYSQEKYTTKVLKRELRIRV